MKKILLPLYSLVLALCLNATETSMDSCYVYAQIEWTPAMTKYVGIQVIESVLGFSHKDRECESDSFENISRIKFSIPLVYPQKIPKLEQLMKNQ